MIAKAECQELRADQIAGLQCTTPRGGNFLIVPPVTGTPLTWESVVEGFNQPLALHFGTTRLQNLVMRRSWLEKCSSVWGDMIRVDENKKKLLFKVKLVKEMWYS
jgi:hypothetical protein